MTIDHEHLVSRNHWAPPGVREEEEDGAESASQHAQAGHEAIQGR